MLWFTVNDVVRGLYEIREEMRRQHRGFVDVRLVVRDRTWSLEIGDPAYDLIHADACVVTRMAFDVNILETISIAAELMRELTRKLGVAATVFP